MTLSIKHKFASTKSDGPDTSLVQPSNWNDFHDILLAGVRLLGRWHSTSGAAEEISIGAGLNLDGASGVLSVDPPEYASGKLLGRWDPADGLPQEVTLSSNVTLDSTTGVLDIVNPVPIGMVVDFAGATAPAKWKFCAGQELSKTTFSALFAVIDVVYGETDGSGHDAPGTGTHFRVPDLRGRVVAGKDNMTGGGGSANRLTGLSGGLNGDILGATGGEEAHSLGITEMPPHGHPFRLALGGGSGDSSGVGGLMVNSDSAPGQENQAAYTGALGNTKGHQIGGAGGTGSPVAVAAHNNVQPTFILNKIIYAGV